jgi:hypothetical protein
MSICRRDGTQGSHGKSSVESLTSNTLSGFLPWNLQEIWSLLMRVPSPSQDAGLTSARWSEAVLSAAAAEAARCQAGSLEWAWTNPSLLAKAHNQA